MALDAFDFLLGAKAFLGLQTKADLVNGKVPEEQLPSYVDDIVEGYYFDGKFYEELSHETEIVGESGKIYVDIPSNDSYRWSGTAYVLVSTADAVSFKPQSGRTDAEKTQAQANIGLVVATDAEIDNILNS